MFKKQMTIALACASLICASTTRSTFNTSPQPVLVAKGGNGGNGQQGGNNSGKQHIAKGGNGGQQGGNNSGKQHIAKGGNGGQQGGNNSGKQHIVTA